MMWPKRAALAVCVLALAVVARADQWNDRTTLKFDAPVMVPGATLAPGTYTFKLADSNASRHIVQIYNEDGMKLVATAQAVPAKRMDPKGDVVVKLNPTEAGAPVALKAWFYPGSLYGHQFIYPDAQAKDIAQRTKTLVLSTDVAGSDMEKGTLYTYNAEGVKEPWKGDERTIQEWTRWNEEGKRAASATLASPGTPASRQSTAPMMHAEPEGARVSIGDFEEHPNQYIGKTISVTAEVEEVFGPRLFKIDEPNWGDLDGEVLVYLPSNLAALVREDDRVTVTGTPKMFVKADLEREIGWLEPDPDVEIEFAERPVLVASRIVGGDSDQALAIEVNRNAARTTASMGSGTDTAVGTSGTAAPVSTPLTDISALGKGNNDLVGRSVKLDDVKVSRRAKTEGFWIEGSHATVFVLPSDRDGSVKAPSEGDSVSIEGIVLEMPRSLRDTAHANGSGNDEIYVYATSVRK